MEQHSGIGVLDKTVAILQATTLGPASLAELIERTQLPRATVHRLAVALEGHRLLVRDAHGRFGCGPRLSELAAHSADPLKVHAGEILAWVRDRSGESAQLYQRDGAERVCVATAERVSGLRTTVPLGARLPMTAGSGAQVLCAWDPELAGTGAPDGATPGDAEAQFSTQSLAQVRRRGWAQSVGQREAGVASVSAPVFDGRDKLVAALSISGPIDRIGRTPGPHFAPILIAAADRLRLLLG